MTIKIRVHMQTGGLWYSDSGKNVHATAINACLENTLLTPKAVVLLERLKAGPITDISIEITNDDIKLISKRTKCKSTISLRHPSRQQTAKSLNRLAQIFSLDAIEPEVQRFQPKLQYESISTKIPDDLLDSARRVLVEHMHPDPSDNLVESVARYIMHRKCLPPELQNRRASVVN